jgi:hypothetical protein
MMSVLTKLQAVDRRIIFLFIAAAIVIPMIAPMGLPIRKTKEVKSVFNSIDALKPGSVVLLSNDYDPASEPELYPMTLAIVRHCFKKDLRVVAMSLWPGAPGIVTRALTVASKEYSKVEGEDFVNLGFKAGQVSVIVAMGQNMLEIFPDALVKGKRVKTSELPVLNGVLTLKDVDYAVDIAAGVPGIDQWMTYGSDQYGFKLGTGCTAVMAADYYPFLASGQIDGLLGGLKGAAEYESLIEKPDKATAGMDAQSIAHLVIIAFVILGNIAYFTTRKTGKS